MDIDTLLDESDGLRRRIELDAILDTLFGGPPVCEHDIGTHQACPDLACSRGHAAERQWIEAYMLSEMVHDGVEFFRAAFASWHEHPAAEPQMLVNECAMAVGSERERKILELVARCKRRAKVIGRDMPWLTTNAREIHNTVTTWMEHAIIVMLAGRTPPTFVGWICARDEPSLPYEA